MEGGAVGHNFERDPPCQVMFNLIQRFQRRRFKCERLRRMPSDGKSSQLKNDQEILNTCISKVILR
jgi:hypothetical protein